MSRDFVGALLQLNAEKQVPRDHLIRTVEEAIAAAYRRVANEEDIHVRIDAESGRIRVFRARTAVSEVEDPLTQFTLDEARPHKPDAVLGDLVETEQLDSDAFGRIGAQTAKQIVLQRIREVERDQVFDSFVNREGELITGTVNRVEPRAIILDVGKNVEAILATTEQSPLEHYRIGQNVKAFVLEVRRTPRGPQIYISRTHKGFLRRLFELEVPEIHNGTVEIKAIARDAGSRSKVAVASRQDGLDPVGATVGQRGTRVQAVVAELGGEKIDVIPWNDDPSQFVANALSPAQVEGVVIDVDARVANVIVPERMLSLAIGRGGQNASLAAKLTGWRINIRSDMPNEPRPSAAAEVAEAVVVEAVVVETTTNGTVPTEGGPSAATTEPAEAGVAKPAKKARAPQAPAATSEPPKAAASKAKTAKAASPTAASPTAASPTAATAKAPARKAAPKKASVATAAEASEATADAATGTPAKATRAKKAAREVAS